MVFIHTADWHIGNSFSCFGSEERKIHREAVLSTVRNIFDYACKNKIPLILAAGDCLDSSRASDEKPLFGMFDIIRSFHEINVVMITGNHDPLVPDNIYSSIDKSNYPENLHFVETDKKIINLEDMNLRIFAASLKEKTGSYNPLSWITGADTDNNMINVGICHGSIINTKYGDNSFPVEPNFAEKAGLDYLALGHWHSYNRINDRTYYSGCPETLQFGDEGYPLKVTINKKGDIPEVEKISGLDNFKWLSVNETISDGSYPDFAKYFKDISSKEVRKASVSGFLSAAEYKSYKEMITMFRDKYIELEDRVRLRPDESDILGCTQDALMKNVIERLFAIKSGKEIFPEEIRDDIIPKAEAGEKIIKKTREINAAEISDRALMKIFQMIKEDSGGI